uniref:LITAF domain-containing protein n=1 Tax=Anopheles maculatus TaxID=74869 RepID=A0A182SE20_9DIPT
MSMLRVKCVFCGLVIDCQREDTRKLMEHLQNEHTEMTAYQPTTAPNPFSNAIATKHEEEAIKSNSSSSEDVTETEELIQRVRIRSPTKDPPDGSSETSSSITSTDEAEHNPPNRPKRARQISIESQRSVLYQTSLSYWRPGGQPICCPDCGARQVPIVRSHANGVTWSSTAASCFLFCWPLCCLSWFLSEPISEYLHCARCDQLLAKHDIKSERIAPNFEMLDRTDEQL